MKRILPLLVLLTALMVLSAACTPPTAQTPTSEEITPQPQDVVTWYIYDQNNEDPASDERVGNAYLRETIPQFNKAFEGQWNWVNQPKAFDKITPELIAAVQAEGDVPDVFALSVSQNVITFYRHGAAQDLRPWAQQQSWWDDLDPNGIEACTAPDGALYCIPMAELPQVVYVWKDHYPDGFPTTPEDFLAHAQELKTRGIYAITFFGSTFKGGIGFTRAIWTTLASFGGAVDDGQGNMLLNTPENIAAIEFLREIVAKDYVPEIAFAGRFREEDAFKDASAGAFPTALFGYRYVNPLSAPNGNKYEKGNAEDMLDAIAAGDVYLAPYLAAPGQKPGCGIDIAGLTIPTGAKNVEGAHAYINWLMEPENNAKWVQGPGGGFPALQSARQNEIFQTPFYQQASAAVEASACRPWFGSLERTKEAQELIMNAIYKLIKESPEADIAEILIQTEEEYNTNSN